MRFLDYVSSMSFFQAAGITLALTLVAMVIGILGGLFLAVLKTGPIRPLRWFADGYIWLFRGTPVLLQLIFVFNVLPAWGLRFSPFTCAVIALSMNEAAYMAEIVRAGLLSVDRGQRTASRVLGLSERQILRWVTLPQAARVILPPTGNQFIGMLKTSALASVIAVQDLLLSAQRLAAANFDYVNALVAAAIYYLALTTLFTLGVSVIERRLNVVKRAAARYKGPGPLVVAAGAEENR